MEHYTQSSHLRKPDIAYLASLIILQVRGRPVAEQEVIIRVQIDPPTVGSYGFLIPVRRALRVIHLAGDMRPSAEACPEIDLNAQRASCSPSFLLTARP
jgi:hypothetical protein